MSKCELCGGKMIVDTSIVLTSIPPQYRTECSKCGHMQYVYIQDCYLRADIKCQNCK